MPAPQLVSSLPIKVTVGGNIIDLTGANPRLVGEVLETACRLNELIVQAKREISDVRRKQREETVEEEEFPDEE